VRFLKFLVENNIQRSTYGTYKVYGYHVLASAMDTTRLCLTLTALVSFVVQQIYVYIRCFKVNQHCSFVGSRTRTLILSLGTYPASLLYSEAFPIVLIVFTPILTCELHVNSLLPTGLQVQVRRRSYLRLTRYKRRV
jgi:hypothetical protein